MSLNDSGEDVEFAAAVAAAAFAITSLESDNVNQRKMEGPESTPSMEELDETLKRSAGKTYGSKNALFPFLLLPAGQIKSHHDHV